MTTIRNTRSQGLISWSVSLPFASYSVNSITASSIEKNSPSPGKKKQQKAKNQNSFQTLASTAAVNNKTTCIWTPVCSYSLSGDWATTSSSASRICKLIYRRRSSLVQTKYSASISISISWRDYTKKKVWMTSSGASTQSAPRRTAWTI